MLLVAGVGALSGVWPWLLVSLPLLAAVLLFANLVFDVVTVRLDLHPTETLPKSCENLDAFDLMRSRVSCRSFQNRKLTDVHRKKVLELAQNYSQPENCIGTRPIRFEYLSAPLTVWPVVHAGEFLVAVAERSYHEEAIVDIGHSLQKVVLDATRMGIATCWIGPGADPSSIAHHLGPRFDPERDHVICVCAIGYASKYKPLSLRLMQKSQRWRKSVSDLFLTGPGRTGSINPAAAPFAEFGRCFEACQWSPSSYNAQPTRAVAVVERDRLIRLDFCAATKSRYYAMVALGIWLANWEYGCKALGISGCFAKISSGEGQGADLPRYVISWVRKA